MTLRELELTAMRRRDLKAVMAIEHQVFPEPWTASILLSELALRKGRSYRVAKVGKQVVGYRGLMFVADEAHITTIAVDPRYQRNGVASILLLDAVKTTLSVGARHLSLEVAKGNEAAQSLYRMFGFVPVGIRKGYYAATGEDAYVMWAYDLDSPQYAERVASIEDRLRSRQ